MTRISLFVFLAGCGLAGAEQAEVANSALPSAAAVRVEVAELGPTEATLDLQLPGEIKGSRDANLAAALGGYIESVRVKEGDQVRAGATLVRVDASLYAAQLDQAQAQQEQAASDLERLEKLGDLAVAAQLQGARTQLRVAQASVTLARARLRRAVVHAPFAGMVAQVAVEKGEVAGPGAPIVRLVQLDPVEVSLAVADRDRVALVAGQEVTVQVPSRARIYTGVVDRVAPVADLRTRAFEVVVAVPNADHSLLPGMIAQVHLSASLPQGAVAIPQDWIVTRRSGSGVFVDVDGYAVWRPIELGAVVHDQVVVTQGVAVGDRVIYAGHRELVDGDPLLVSREGVCCTDGRVRFP